MNIPDKVKIGGITYDIKFDTKPCRCDLNADGEIRYSEQIISIREGLYKGSDYKDYVLLHEIIHGIFNHFCIEQNEELVEKLSKGLHMVIKDNPNIFKED